MKVHIDDAIRGKPELYDAVVEATKFLEVQSGKHAADLDVLWELADSDDRLIWFRVSADGGLGRRGFPWKNLLDPVNRQLRVLQTWGYLLEDQSRLNLERIDRRMAELREETAHA